MNHTFVTSFFDLSLLEKRNNDTNYYVNHGTRLLSYPYNFIVFIDKKSREIFETNFGNKENVVYIEIEIEELPLYKKINKDLITLPSIKDQNKDTINYMLIMLSKIYFGKEETFCATDSAEE